MCFEVGDLVDTAIAHEHRAVLDEPVGCARPDGGVRERLAFSPSGKLLLSAGHDRTLKWWDASVMAEQGGRKLLGHRAWVHSVSFSSDGNYLASIGNNEKSLKLWDVTADCMLQEFNSFTRTPFYVSFSPKDAILAFNDGPTIRLMSLATWKPVDLFAVGARNDAYMSFTPDGDHLVASNAGVTKIFDLTARQVRQVLRDGA